MARAYNLTIWSNFSRGREYRVYSRDALKMAHQYGRGEFGETVVISEIRSHKILSRAVYSVEDDGGFYRTYVAPGEKLED